MDERTISKWVAFASLGTGLAACEPRITIADETSGAGEAGRADAGRDNGGASSSGGASSGGASGGSSGAADSGTGGADTTGGGGTAAGGTSGAAAGTAGVPGPARLGLRLLLQDPDEATTEVAGRLCPTGTGVEWDIGAPIVANGMVVDVASPTPADPGATLADGEEEADLECLVRSDGTITAEGGGIDPMITPPNGRVNFTVSRTPGAIGGTSTMALSFYTPLTQFVETTEEIPCTMSSVYELAPGRFWGDFECPALAKTGDPAVACKATGTVVLENCRIE